MSFRVRVALNGSADFTFLKVNVEGDEGDARSRFLTDAAEMLEVAVPEDDTAARMYVDGTLLKRVKFLEPNDAVTIAFDGATWRKPSSDQMGALADGMAGTGMGEPWRRSTAVQTSDECQVADGADQAESVAHEGDVDGVANITWLTDDTWLIILTSMRALDLFAIYVAVPGVRHLIIGPTFAANSRPPPAVLASAARRALHLDRSCAQAGQCWRLMQPPGTLAASATWRWPWPWPGGRSWLAILRAAELNIMAAGTHPEPSIQYGQTSGGNVRWQIELVRLPTDMIARSAQIVLRHEAFQAARDAPRSLTFAHTMTVNTTSLRWPRTTIVMDERLRTMITTFATVSMPPESYLS